MTFSTISVRDMPDMIFKDVAISKRRLIFVYFRRNKSDPAIYPIHMSNAPRSWRFIFHARTQQCVVSFGHMLKVCKIIFIYDMYHDKACGPFQCIKWSTGKSHRNESHSDVAFKLVENSNNKRIFINSTELWRRKWINWRNLRSRWKKSEQ